MLSSIGGALLKVDIQEFVFIYLFWGCLGGLVISLILHRVGAVTALGQRDGLSATARMDGDGLRRGLGDQKNLDRKGKRGHRVGVSPFGRRKEGASVFSPLRSFI